jgi:NAD(P)-dependent dehydrogenase (short-subunit alcohol dehydrogenase family)
MSDVAITGATGYLGRALSAALLTRGHTVRALVRPGGAARVTAGVEPSELDVFDQAQLAGALRAGDTLVHLIGTPHPNPRKAAEFERVDLASVRAAAMAAAATGIAHLVYVSVAQPAPIMQAYVGHRWPYLLLPLYALAQLLPASRETARRLGMVTLAQMTRTMLRAVEQPPPAHTIRVVDVPQIRTA